MGETTVRALDGSTCTSGGNEFVAVMGASGSGKSTLMNILGCLDKPTEGSYHLNGREVSRLNDDELSFTRNKHLGFVFQNFNLLPRYSALKNTYLPLKYSPAAPEAGLEKAAKMLELAGLAGRLHHRPSQLSGGKCQRSPSPGPWSTTRISSWPTNRPGIWTPRRPMRLCRCCSSCTGAATTIVMVTHETTWPLRRPDHHPEGRKGHQ